MAVFCLSNHGRRMYTHYSGFTELRTRRGWAYDTNQLASPHSAAAVLEAGQTTLVTVATPPGTPSWRCNLTLTRLTQRPYWQWRFGRVLSKLGVDFDGEQYTISSGEIER
jgi:hypothetical protein